MIAVSPKTILLIVLAFALGVFTRGCGREEPASAPSQTTQPSPLRKDIKAIDLVHFEGRREIAPGQTIAVFRIDDPLVPNLKGLSKICLLYENHADHIAQFTCIGPQN